jgi:acyl carrier protein
MLLLVGLAMSHPGCDRSPTTGKKLNVPTGIPASSTARVATVPAAGNAPVQQSEKPVPAAQVEDKVLEIMAKQFGVRKSELNRNVDLKRDLKSDELDLVEIVMEVEDAFDLRIKDEQADLWQTVGQVVDYVRTNYKP